MSFIKFRVQTGRRSEILEPKNKDDMVEGPDTLLNHHPSLAYLRQPQGKSIPSNTIVIPDSEADTDKTASHLKWLTRTLQELLLDPTQLSHPLLRKHISPSFSATIDGYGDSRSRDDHLARWAEEFKYRSDYRAEIVESVAEIHESGRRATVWTFKRLSGLPVTSPPRTSRNEYATDSGICKESVAIMKWELRGKDWVCVRLKMVNGVSGFA